MGSGRLGRVISSRKISSALSGVCKTVLFCAGIGTKLSRPADMVSVMDSRGFALEMGTGDQQQQRVLDDVCDDDKGVGKLMSMVLGDLPVDVLALILCHLLPRDVARAACVSRAFRAASMFDCVWENVALTHLPLKYKELLALDPAVVQFATTRDLFHHLSANLVFFNNHTQGFWLDRGTGGICVGMGARTMYIEHGGDHRYWRWVSGSHPEHHKALFPEVARLKEVCWFEAVGETECSLPAGTYTVSWRLLLDKLQNWRSKPVTFRMSKNGEELVERKCFIDPRPHHNESLDLGFRAPSIRVVENGWREYDVGEFEVKNSEETFVLKFSMTAIEEGQPWKSGLTLDGVVVRPSITVADIQPESRESLIRFLEVKDHLVPDGDNYEEFVPRWYEWTF